MDGVEYSTLIRRIYAVHNGSQDLFCSAQFYPAREILQFYKLVAQMSEIAFAGILGSGQD